MIQLKPKATSHLAEVKSGVPPLAPRFAPLLAAVCATVAGITSAAAEQWTVPLGGNSYLTSANGRTPDRVETAGIKPWGDEKSVFSIYFRTDRAAELDLSLRLKVPQGESLIRATVAGSVFEKKVSGEGIQEVSLGNISVKAPGYVRVDLQGLSKQGAVFAEVIDLLVDSDVAELKVNCVKDSEGNRFYWGRRGPSVHLPYEVPAGMKIEYFYNEVMVPEGQDAIGSYFMANGFGEGYFGMQVNGPQDRRVLFSVWSPFHTDNPKEIPEEERVQVLARGQDVRIGEFGNEGSGGQSFYTFPWKAGTIYRFLNRAHPDGKSHTIYSAWFYAPEAGKWQLIATFRRPKTDKHLTGIHSFLENFNDRNGYLSRLAYYGNQWVRDTEGEWHELTKSRFSGDDIANRQYRLDFAGGSKGAAFFLHNGGFFDETVKLGSSFERESTASRRPVIDLDALEGAK
jgi:hypothetical protein